MNFLEIREFVKLTSHIYHTYLYLDEINSNAIIVSTDNKIAIEN